MKFIHHSKGIDMSKFKLKSNFFRFKIPYVSVNSVDEYFSLDKKEREWYGLYRTPESLPCEFFKRKNKQKGWSSFYEEIKKDYPIQYFFRRWIFSFSNPLYAFYKKIFYWPFNEFKIRLRRVIKPLHPRWRSVLPIYEYMDINELMVKSNFALILDFYYEEVKNGYTDWNADEYSKKFYKGLKLAVDWIEIKRKDLLNKIDEELIYSTKNPVEKGDGIDYHKTYKKYNTLENQLSQKDTKVLNWFVENRHIFWT